MAHPLSERLFSLIQYPLPHHALSRVMHRLTRCEHPAWKNAFIHNIVKLYDVDLDEALEPNPDAYPSFNAFFTRALKPSARPLCGEPDAVLCPADGAISQVGKIDAGRIVQAKGKHFTATELLGGDVARAEPFQNGQFATVYLSPRDYHRLHMPLAGTLKEMVHIPGRLFSVNTATANQVPNLFARNERVAAIFDTDAGPMALILVGAIFVASIETVWHGVVTPPAGMGVRVWNYPDAAIQLARGAEMGRFNMGSTIIVLFGENAIAWDALSHGAKVRMGGRMGHILPR